MSKHTPALHAHVSNLAAMAVATFFCGAVTATADIACYTSESSTATGTSGFDFPEQWSNGISPTNEAASSTDYRLCKGRGATDAATPGLANNKGGTMRGPQSIPQGGSVTVLAKSFQIGIKSRAGTFRDCRMADRPLVFANDGLVLMRGEFYREPGRSNDGEIGGKVTVANAADIATTGPFEFYGSATSDGSGIGKGGYRMTGAWASDAGAKINFFTQWTAENHPDFFTVAFHGDMSQFRGSMSVATNTCRVLMDGKAMPGTVHVDGGAMFGAVAASNTVSVGTLDLADGARLVLPVDNAKGEVARLRVTTALSSVGVATLLVSTVPSLETGARVPLLTLASGGTGTPVPSAFRLAAADGRAIPEKLQLSVAAGPEAGETSVWLDSKVLATTLIMR